MYGVQRARRDTAGADPMRTRMLKAICGDCAYTVRLSRKWLLEAGEPLCPIDGHGRMECAQWEELCEAELETWEADARADAALSAPKILRDAWVDTRAPHDCAKCRETIPHPDRMRHTVYTIEGALRSEYVCFRCDGAGAAGVRTALARA